MLELDRALCLRLLADAGVGRIAVNVPDWPQPVIRPVSYVFDESSQSVLIRSALGSKLYAVIRSAKAAFEIDGTDPVGRVGWSVIIHGSPRRSRIRLRCDASRGSASTRGRPATKATGFASARERSPAAGS